MIISGLNFSTNATENQVFFNGIAATIISSTANTITVYAPSGFKSWRVTVGNGKGVAVSNGVFGNVPSFATDPFISEFYPIQGAVGSRLVIKGKNFSTTASLNFISFGGAFVTSLSSTSTTLDLAVPAGASSGSVTVTVGAKNVQSVDPFTVLPGTTTYATEGNCEVDIDHLDLCTVQ